MKLKNAVALFLIFAVFVFVNAGNISLAEENQNFISLAYNSLDKVINISGRIGITANTLTTLTILPEWVDPGSLSDANLPSMVFPVLTKNEGAFYAHLTIPDTFASGKYYVYASNQHGSEAAYFLYAADNDILYVLKEVNKGSSEKGIQSVLEANLSKIAAEESVFMPVSADAAAILFAVKPKGGFSEQDTGAFLSCVSQCIAAALIKNDGDILRVISTYAYDLNIDMAVFLKYPQKVQDEFVRLIKAVDFKSKTMSELVPEIVVLSFFRSSETWGEAMLNILGQNTSGQTINNNFEVLNPDMSYYSRIKNKNSVFQQLFNNKSAINSFSELKRKFQYFSRAVFDEESKNTIPGGGSQPSGGSYSGGGAYSYSKDVVSSEPVHHFTDTVGHWAQISIDFLVNRLIISGYPDGRFLPDNKVSRAEFLKMVVLAFDLPKGDLNIAFKDVSGDHWHAGYVQAAVFNNITNGYTDDEFMPDAFIKRQDACLMIYRFLKTKYTIEAAPSSYHDKEEISDYAAEAVNAMTQIRIISGMGNNMFEPLSSLTRAQAAVIISNALKYIESH